MIKFLLFSLFLFTISLQLVHCSVVALTPADFDAHVDGSKAVFVEFYAPWCGHCKHLEPEYDKVGEAFAGSSVITVAKVDADAHKELGSRFGVTGFPTLKFFPKGWKKGEEPVVYSGGRTTDDISAFIAEKTGAKYKKPKAAPSHVVELTDKNFDSIVMDTTKDVLVEFYAPWCGHCKRLVPDYEKVANAFQNEKSVVVAKLDADNAAHKAIATRFGVSGFPTIKFFGKHNKNGEDYSSERDPASFVNFLNEKSGTSRTVTGALGDKAGRIPTLDEIAAKFVSGDQKALLVEAKNAIKELAGDAAKHAQYYIKAMEKVVSDGQSFVATEVARLEKLIDSASTAASKIDEFVIRRNILKAFQ